MTTKLEKCGCGVQDFVQNYCKANDVESNILDIINNNTDHKATQLAEVLLVGVVSIMIHGLADPKGHNPLTKYAESIFKEALAVNG